MMNAIAIDDEPLALSVLQEHAAQVSFINLCGLYTNLPEGLQRLNGGGVELLFLDINMPDASGLEIARRYSSDLQVVFTTAYPEYALQGFELDVADYLLKPIGLVRFLHACQKAAARLQPVVKPVPALYLRDGSEWIHLPPDDILYLEAKGNYVLFTTTGGTHLIRHTLQDLLLQLPPVFHRIHKSYIIHTGRISRLEVQQVTIGYKRLPVSRAYSAALLAKLGLK